MKGKFFAVGLGPGDPQLLTLKAIDTIKRSDVIAVPKSGASENIALKIAGDYIEGKPLLQCDMPMIKDKKRLDECHDKSADLIAELLEEGKTVAFLTLGDPAIYSTVMYVHKRLTERGYDTSMVPGVPSFCGAAASLNMALCERDETLHVIPAVFEENISRYDDGVNVLMKSGKSIMDIKERLAGKKAMLVECATMENEKIYKDLNDLEEQSSYFSLIIVPK